MYHFFIRLLFVVSFIVGILSGVLVSYLLSVQRSDKLKETDFSKAAVNPSYNKWFSENSLKRKKVPLDRLRYGGSQEYLLESQYLYEKVDVLCVILVRNSKNAAASNNTWAQNCNDVKFVHLSDESKRKMMPAKKTKGNSSWTLLCKALQALPADFSWYLILNDSTFAILENLRLMIAGLNPNEKHYIGHAIEFWATTYNMGQAGYVISKATLQVLKNKFHSADSCLAEATYMNQEDLYLGKILTSFNVQPMDTRDSLGLTTFHSYNWQHEFFPGVNYYKFSVYPVVCCSSQSVTFQAIEADKIYMYYYLLYQLQVFTHGTLGNRPASTPIPQEEVWQSFLKTRGYSNMDISAQEYYKIWEDLVHDPTAFAQELLGHKYEYIE